MAFDRDELLVVVAGVLAIAGLGLLAGTITATYSSGYQGVDGPSVDGPSVDGPEVPLWSLPDGPDQTDPGPVEPGPDPLADICIEVLTQTPAIIGLVLGLLGMVAFAYRRRGFVAAGFVGYLLGIPLVLGYGLTTQCGRAPAEPDDGGLLWFLDGAIPGLVSPVGIPPAALAGIVAVAALAAIAVVASARGSDELAVDGQPLESLEEDSGLQEFGAVAGNAADRIASTDADVDNAVFRAWRDMTALLDVDDPDTSTAGEFAGAAVRAGVDRDDVEDLTRLFEEVRYGDLDPGPREEFALEILRRVETTYGESDGADATRGE